MQIIIAKRLMSQKNFSFAVFLDGMKRIRMKNFNISCVRSLSVFVFGEGKSMLFLTIQFIIERYLLRHCY